MKQHPYATGSTRLPVVDRLRSDVRRGAAEKARQIESMLRRCCRQWGRHNSRGDPRSPSTTPGASSAVERSVLHGRRRWSSETHPRAPPVEAARHAEGRWPTSTRRTRPSRSPTGSSTGATSTRSRYFNVVVEAVNDGGGLRLCATADNFADQCLYTAFVLVDRSAATDSATCAASGAGTSSWTPGRRMFCSHPLLAAHLHARVPRQ